MSSRRILIVKLGAIGDVIMAIPGAYALHQRGYAVDWVCAAAIAPVLRLYPWITVIEINDGALHGHKMRALKTGLGLWRRLAGYNYDIVATLAYDRRYRLLTFSVSAPRHVHLDRTRRDTMMLPGRHHTDEYARILLAQTGEPYANGETPTQLAPVSPENLPANPLPRTTKKPRIVLFPGGAKNILRDDPLRRWPLESYASVAKALLARGCEVIFAGGPDDTWASSALASAGAHDVIGKFALPETLALLASADVTITHDTGPLHLAGLTPTSIVAIFGPTDPHGRLPQRNNAVALWGGEGFACRPCYDGRDYAPCSNNGCMQQITPTMVLAETETLLKAMQDKQPMLPRIRVPKHTPVQLIQPSPLSMSPKDLSS